MCTIPKKEIGKAANGKAKTGKPQKIQDWKIKKKKSPDSCFPPKNATENISYFAINPNIPTKGKL